MSIVDYWIVKNYFMDDFACVLIEFLISWIDPFNYARVNNYWYLYCMFHTLLFDSTSE